MKKRKNIKENTITTTVPQGLIYKIIKAILISCGSDTHGWDINKLTEKEKK